jgi:apolipoprotein N-acyltransferase
MLKFTVVKTCVKNYGLPILSGIFIGTSYIPFPPWAALFGFVPLWIFWLRQTELKPVIFGGMTTAFVFTLIGFNWMTYLLHEFAGLPWIFAVVGMILYALFAHTFVAIAGAVWFLLKRKLACSNALSLALLAIITILSEAYSFTLFDWNFGYSWFGYSVPIYQLAEIVGFSGLSAITLAFNLPIYLAWKYRTEQKGKIIFGSVLGVFALLNLSGVALEARLPKPDAEFNVLMVQGNVGSMEKMAAESGDGYGQVILNRYLSLTHEALEAHKNEKIDFVFWAESAFPTFLGENLVDQNDYPRQLREFLKQHNVPLVTGAYSVKFPDRLLTNSLFLLDEQGEIIPPHYSKTILLAFGEYIPFEEFFPQIRNFLPPIGHFARGDGATTLFNLRGLKMAPQICYEGLFAYFSRDLANLGADAIVNVTNDSWYGTWQQPYQHFYMTLARGVEFRRPVLRVTNTGISSVGLASGEILQRSPIHEMWADVYRVPYLKNPPATFYQQWFYLLPILLWLIFASLLIVAIKQRVMSRKVAN